MSKKAKRQARTKKPQHDLTAKLVYATALINLATALTELIKAIFK